MFCEHCEGAIGLVDVWYDGVPVQEDCGACNGVGLVCVEHNCSPTVCGCDDEDPPRPIKPDYLRRP